MNINKFDILKFDNGEGCDSEFFRVLKVFSLDQTISLIKLDRRKVTPKIFDLSDIISRIKVGDVILIKTDPYHYRFWSDFDFSPEQLKRRDNIWNKLKPFLIEYKEDLYLPKRQRKVRQKITAALSLPPAQVTRYITRYLQRGEVPNAFIPDYQNCGSANNLAHGLKRGPLSTFEKHHNLPRRGETTVKTIELMLHTIEQYYLKQSWNSLRDAYLQFIRLYQKNILNDSNKHETQIDISQLPSFRQFKYLYQKTTNPTQSAQARKGMQAFNLNHRELLSDNLIGVHGPLARVETDSKILRIKLVSRLNRSVIIGDVILYLLVDVFSRVIVGFHIGINNASWKEACKSLANMVSWKELCDTHDVEYRPELFPHDHMLPKSIVADRGEYEGPVSNVLVNAYGIELISTPPYRPDYKGLVESLLGVIQRDLINKLPGSYKKRYRGEIPPEKDACLNLWEIRQIVLKYIIWRNNQHVLDGYPLTEDMRADAVKPIPNEIFKWGIESISGLPRLENSEELKRNLLPRDFASVTKFGIRFKGLLYICETALKDNWFSNARIRGRWRIPISFDPDNPQLIYWLKDKGQYEVCLINEDKSSNQPFLNSSLYEILDEEERLRIQRQNNSPTEYSSKIDIHEEIQQLVKNTYSEAAESKKGISNYKLKKDVREKRKQEQLLENLPIVETETPDAPDTSNESNLISDVTTHPEWYVAEPNRVGQFRALRNKLYKNKFKSEDKEPSDENA